MEYCVCQSFIKDSVRGRRRGAAYREFNGEIVTQYGSCKNGSPAFLIKRANQQQTKHLRLCMQIW